MRRSGMFASDLAQGVFAGALATWVMESVSSFLYQREDPDAREREDQVRQGKAPFVVAAEKTAELTGQPLTEEQKSKLGMVFHWGLGLGAGAAYAALRRRRPFLGWGQGLVFGALFFLLVDEGLNTVLGLTPKPAAYPWQAHARGLAAHLVYGVAADSTLDVLERVA